MSLEKISHVISNAFKSASAVYTGSPDEKFALDALGGLAGLVEARARQQSHINTPTTPGSGIQKPRSFANVPNPPAAPPPPVPGAKPAPTLPDESYDLK
jgi:hypothetical protein